MRMVRGLALVVGDSPQTLQLCGILCYPTVIGKATARDTGHRCITFSEKFGEGVEELFMAS